MAERLERTPEEMDAEANQFALALLMPAEMVRREVAKMKGFDICENSDIKKLADKFRVPVTAMAIRLGQLMKGPAH